MFDTFTATLSPMLVMFLCMALGFIMKKKNLAPENSATVLSKIENYICMPFLVFNTFMTSCTVSSLKKDYELVLYSLFTLFTAFVIGLFLAKAFSEKGSYQRKIYSYALVFGNFGFMGNAIVPIILAHMGSDILYKYLLFTLPMQTAVYTWGISSLIPLGKEKKNPLKNLINPIFFAIILGIFFGLTGLGKFIPQFLLDTMNSFADCMAPLAMFLTGFVVAGYSTRDLLSNGKIYVATFLRLILLPSVLLLLLYIIRAPKFVLTLAFFAYAEPLGMNTVVFPAAYGGETKTGASMAIISHVLSIVTIPLLYALFTALI